MNRAGVTGTSFAVGVVMPRNQIPPEEFEPSRRGGAAGHEHHEPEPDGRIDRPDPKRNDDDGEVIGSRHPSYRDDEDDLDDDLDRVSYPGGVSSAGRSPGREAEAGELDDADLLDELDDLEDDDLPEIGEPEDPDEPDE